MTHGAVSVPSSDTAVPDTDAAVTDRHFDLELAWTSHLYALVDQD